MPNVANMLDSPNKGSQVEVFNIIFLGSMLLLVDNCVPETVISLVVIYKIAELLQGRKEMFYLMKHSTHFIYGYMASDIW